MSECEFVEEWVKRFNITQSLFRNRLLAWLNKTCSFVFVKSLNAVKCPHGLFTIELIEDSRDKFPEIHNRVAQI